MTQGMSKPRFTISLTELKDSGVVDMTALPATLRRIVGIAARARLAMAAALATSLGAAVFSVLMPKLLGSAVDQAHSLLIAPELRPGTARHALWVTATLVAGVALGRGLLQMLSGYCSEYVGQKLGYTLRLAFFRKLLSLDFRYHDQIHTGDLITRGMLDLEGVRGFIENGLQRIVSLAFLLIFGCWMMFSRDPVLAVLALSFVPFVGWRAARTGLFLRFTWTKVQELLAVVTRVMEENLQGMRVVRAFAARDFELAKFDKAADSALELSNHRILLRAGSISVMSLAYHLSLVAMLWVGCLRVRAGLITVGHLTEFLTFMTVLQQPIRQIAMIVNSSARATSSGGRLFDILDRVPDIKDREGAPDLVLTEGTLRFEHVDFSYESAPDAPRVLGDVSFEVRRGRTLGIVGPPGSGKSTLVHLISRFYDVSGGSVSIDGQDVRDVTLSSLRGAVALIPQDVFLFDQSVGDNVAYAEPGAEEERLVAATSVAQIHDHLAGLPEAYRTRVGERGVSLSGGQRQRLTIARAIVPEPAILVLDDATSAVDAATEARIREAMKGATRDKATIIIAHRLSSLLHADEILVLDKGRVIERGSHAELMVRGGRYAALYRQQAVAARTLSGDAA